MSEKYPKAWRDTCLSLLQAHKEEVRKSLGFKRLGWDVIRDRIMRDYDEFLNGEIFRRSDRLVRQNLESWERGRSLTDEKFRFIDEYVRALAVDGQDEEAVSQIRRLQFERGAELFQNMYSRRSPIDLPHKDIFEDFPWAYYADNIIGTWYKSLAMFGLGSHLGVVKVLFAYMPKSVDDLGPDDFKQVVFMEGFLIPLGYKSEKFDLADHPEVDPDDIPTKRRLKCAVKLTRPEFQGLSGIGYADGEIHIPEFDQFWEFSLGLRSLILEYPSPVPCPTIERPWMANRLGKEVALDGDVNVINKQTLGPTLNMFYKYEFQFQIYLQYVTNFGESILRDMLASTYAGYIY